MQGAKAKVKDMVSVAKEKVKVSNAKAEEKVGMATAHNKKEKAIVKERAKAKEAQAKAQMHQEKALHLEEAMHRHVPVVAGRHHHPIGTTTAAAPAVPGAYPGRPATGKYQ